MSDTLIQDIIFKILKIASDNSDLKSDQQFNLAQEGIRAMFAQLINESTASSSGAGSDGDKARTKRKMKKKDRNQRKKHVGRFFLRLMEKKYQKARFARLPFSRIRKVCHVTIGEEN